MIITRNEGHTFLLLSERRLDVQSPSGCVSSSVLYIVLNILPPLCIVTELGIQPENLAGIVPFAPCLMVLCDHTL